MPRDGDSQKTEIKLTYPNIQPGDLSPKFLYARLCPPGFLSLPMKTPISYYGGKQNMIPELLPLIPAHKIYCEPFVGGGALFWAKPRSYAEVINDVNDNLINFYRVMKEDFDALHHEIQCTLHSRSLHAKAKEIYLNPDDYSPAKRAWALWVQCNMSFGKKIFAGWAYERLCKDEKGNKSVSSTQNKKKAFHQYRDRLEKAYIECNDAIKVIESWDHEDAFFYLDPPYVESDCGHYDELKEVYYRLLEVLPTIKGKFLMSSYPSEELDAVRATNGYKSKDIIKNLSVDGRTETKKKTECLTWNYQEPQLKLF